MIRPHFARGFQNKVICKKAVSMGWCSQRRGWCGVVARGEKLRIQIAMYHSILRTASSENILSYAANKGADHISRSFIRVAV